MADPFDPYQQWFQIPPEDQPPNHYRLLGLALYEYRQQFIEEAVERRVAFLQDVATGPRGKESQLLLNAVAAARLCLMDPKQKAKYDSVLRTPPTMPEPNSDAPAIVDPLLINRPALEKMDKSRREHRTLSSAMQALLISGVALCLLVATLLLWNARPASTTPATVPIERNKINVADKAVTDIDDAFKLPQFETPDPAFKPPPPAPMTHQMKRKKHKPAKR